MQGGHIVTRQAVCKGIVSNISMLVRRDWVSNNECFQGLLVGMSRMFRIRFHHASVRIEYLSQLPHHLYKWLHATGMWITMWTS